MNRFYYLLSTLLLISALTARAGFSPYTGTGTWENFDLLPSYELYESMYNDALDIADDLNSGGGKYYLEYKMKGGSSHQLLVKRSADNKTMGIWSAPNHATYILGEIFAFNLARLLGRPYWAAPGTRMTLTGPGRRAAYNAMNNPNSPRSRNCNKYTILNYIEENPHYIVGAYMHFEDGSKPFATPDVVDRSNKYRLNGSHFIVKFLNKNYQQPTGTDIYLNPNKSKGNALSYSKTSDSYVSSEAELAKSLSFMMIVDALNSQRDRFGPYGSNMEVMLNKNTRTFAFSLIDNGGIADSSKTISKKYLLGNYGNSVTRFEREVFDKVIELDNLINKGIPSSLLGFNSEEEVKIALGYESNPSENFNFQTPSSCRSSHNWLLYSLKTRWDKRWSAFKAALKDVAAYLKRYDGDSDAFFIE